MAEPKLKKAITFGEFLSDLDNGEVERQATEQLRKLVRAVKDTNKKGKLTITIDLECERNTMVLASGMVSAKAPMPATQSTPLYTDEEGNTALYDMKQEQLRYLRDKPATTSGGDS